MDILLSFVVLAVPAFGWGTILSRRGRGLSPDGYGAGLLLFLGLMAVTIMMYLGVAIFSLPASLLARILAAVGVVLFFMSSRRLATLAFNDKTHPVFLMAGGVLLIALLFRGGQYIPYAWDEFSNWLGAAKQIFYVDHIIDSRMQLSHPETPPGWPLLMGLPSFVLGYFSENLAYGAILLLHISFLGLIYDVTRVFLKGRFGPGNEKANRMAAWFMVLLLVVVEASWKLAPGNLLVERPQIYTLGAALLFSAWGVYANKDQVRIAGYLGLAVAVSYLIKPAAMVFVPSMGMVVLYLCYLQKDAGPRNIIGTVLASFVPFLVIYGTWSFVKPGSICTSSILTLLDPARINLINSPKTIQMASDYGQAVLDYFISYKWGLTVVSVAALMVTLTKSKARVVTLSLMLFVLAYLGALLWTYIVCENGFNYFLSSLQRYIRVPLRLVHISGVFAAVLLSFNIISRLSPAIAASKHLGRVLYSGGWVILAALFVLAGRQTYYSIQDVFQRGSVPLLASRYRAVTRAFPRLLGAFPAESGYPKTILIVTDQTESYEQLIANYLSYGKGYGGQLTPFSFTTKRVRELRSVRNGADFLRQFGKYDALWVFAVDPAADRFVTDLTDGTSCAGIPAPYLVQLNKGKDKYACRPQ